MRYSWPRSIRIIQGTNAGLIYTRNDHFPYEIYGVIVMTNDFVGPNGVVSQAWLYQHQNEWEDFNV